MKEYILVFSCLMFLLIIGTSLLVFNIRRKKRKHLPLSTPLTVQQKKYVMSQLYSLHNTNPDTIFLGFGETMHKVRDNTLSPDETKRLNDLLYNMGISIGNIIIIK